MRNRLKELRALNAFAKKQSVGMQRKPVSYTHLDVYKRQVLYLSSFMLGIVSTIVGLLGLAVLVTYSVQNGVILLVIAFLVSPAGLPIAAVWLVGKVQDLRYAIQDAVYG